MANCVPLLSPHLLSPAPHLPEHSGVRKRGPEEGHVISGSDGDLEGRAVPVETSYQPDTPNSPLCPAPCWAQGLPLGRGGSVTTDWVTDPQDFSSSTLGPELEWWEGGVGSQKSSGMVNEEEVANFGA